MFIRLSAAIKVSTIPRICSVTGDNVGSDSRARVAKDLLPTRSRFVKSFSAIESKRKASGRLEGATLWMKKGCSIRVLGKREKKKVRVNE